MESFLKLPMTNITYTTVIIILISTTILGMLLSLALAFIRRKEGYDRSFVVTLMLLPLIIAIIIMLVSDNVARAFSLAGVFTLVRFRTTVSDTKDITFVFSTVAIGLSTGMGYIGYAMIITAFIILVLLIIHILKLDDIKDNHAKLKIVVPESLNYVGAFEPILESYCTFAKLKKVKTTDFGTTFELTYLINMKSGISQKAFIDDLRVINGNLNIILTQEYIERSLD